MWHDMWSFSIMGSTTRSMAFCIVTLFFISTAVGSLLPEIGTIMAVRLNIWSHALNIIFAILGVIGIGVALYLGYRTGS